jgi:hypothetical protein
MAQVSYRDHIIRYHALSEWLAYVYPPGSQLPLPDVLTATHTQGEQVLLAKARKLVDRVAETQTKE